LNGLLFEKFVLNKLKLVIHFFIRLFVHLESLV
jgi:hypothetical protein